jgi:hypothetical protein
MPHSKTGRKKLPKTYPRHRCNPHGAFLTKVSANVATRMPHRSVTTSIQIRPGSGARRNNQPATVRVAAGA